MHQTQIKILTLGLPIVLQYAICTDVLYHHKINIPHHTILKTDFFPVVYNLCTNLYKLVNVLY